MEESIIKVEKQNNDERIDKFLTSFFDNKSRSFIQGLIEKDLILVNNKKVKSNYKVKENDEIIINMPEAELLEVQGEDIPINILYEDKDVIVVNKDKGMVVHPAPGNYNGTLVNALLFHAKDLSSINGVIRPGIVHRIDKDTSGVLVIAKNDNSHNILSNQLSNHSMTREYLALVEGRIKEDSGTINKPLGRNKKDRLKMGIVEDGKRAVTNYYVLERYNNASLVKCVLETGRTHQIRVHMSSIHHPLIGDPLYGLKKSKYKQDGQKLHAKKLGFIHPTLDKYMEFESEPPKDFNELLEKLRNEVRK